MKTIIERHFDLTTDHLGDVLTDIGNIEIELEFVTPKN